jgi:hypothetical protein
VFRSVLRVTWIRLLTNFTNIFLFIIFVFLKNNLNFFLFSVIVIRKINSQTFILISLFSISNMLLVLTQILILLTDIYYTSVKMASLGFRGE